MTTKEEVRAILDKLPDDCSLEDVQYHLYVIEKIKNSIDTAERDGVLSHADVEQRMRKWTSP